MLSAFVYSDTCGLPGPQGNLHPRGKRWGHWRHHRIEKDASGLGLDWQDVVQEREDGTLSNPPSLHPAFLLSLPRAVLVVLKVSWRYPSCPRAAPGILSLASSFLCSHHWMLCATLWHGCSGCDHTPRRTACSTRAPVSPRGDALLFLFLAESLTACVQGAVPVAGARNACQQLSAIIPQPARRHLGH